MNKDILLMLEQVLRASRLDFLKSVEEDKFSDTELISCRLLFDDWQQTGIYNISDTVNYDNKLYKCITPHDASHYQGWQATLWAPYHSSDPLYALQFEMPGGHAPYKKGEYCVFEGKVWECIADSTVYSPGEYAPHWQLYDGEM